MTARRLRGEERTAQFRRHHKNFNREVGFYDIIRIMKHLMTSWAACMAALSVFAAEPVRRIVLSDESRARIHYYDSTDPAKCFWVDAEKSTWDMQPVGTRQPGQIGCYRYLCRSGFKVVDMDARKHVDEFRHPALNNLSAVSDLPDGGFIATVNPGGKKKAILVRRFSKDRKLVCTYTFSGIFNCRTMQRLENGELVLAHETGFSHVRLPEGDRDQEGVVIRSGRMPHARNMYHALPTNDGAGYWGGAGYAAEVVHFDRNGKVLQTFSAPSKDGLKGYFYGQIKEMDDKRLLVTNWTGHRPDDSKKGWQLIEFDANREVSWTLYDPKRYGSIHGFVELEGPGLPLVDKSSAWWCSPLGWVVDRKAGTVRSKGLTDFALAETTRAAETDFHVRVTPEAAGTNGWATLGLSLYDDRANYWHLALVRTPPENGEQHWFELCEQREGTWLSQNIDKLVRTEWKVQGGWEFGQTYDLSLKTTPAGIRGEVKNAAGKTLFVCAYAFPRAAKDSVKAVTNGSLALHTTGMFRGTFSRVSATTAEPRVKPAETFPPYQNESFVPDVKDRATGFFHTAEKDGRWWVIDPLGRGMVLLGVDHVTYHGHRSQRTGKAHHLDANRAKFPDKRDWEMDTLARLKGWGFNMLGAGCDAALKHRGLVHTIFLSIGDALCWNALNSEYFICPNEHRPCSAFPNVFHPDFPAWADYVARRSCEPNRNDPWLFGYFIDNELAWWGRGRQDTGLFEAVAKLPATHPARVAQQEFLAARGVKGAVPAEVKLDFLRLAADRYFRICSEAIRRYDPNHLVMGARFAGLGGAHAVVWEASGKYCDVVTFNCYPWADLDRNVMLTDRGANARQIAEAFTEQYGYVKKPMLVTEWSFPALDSGLPCTGGAGQRFRTQALRTQATELFAKTMLSLPFLVGYDYFMWVDEPPEGISDAFPEDSNYGLINEKGEAYPEITGMFTRLHQNISKWRKAPLPAMRPAAPSTGLKAADFLARLPKAAATARATFTRAGDAYIIRNTAGLVLEGRVGGPNFFDKVTLNGRVLGQYSGMLNDRVGGSLRWRDINKVTSVDLQESEGRVIVTVTGARVNDEATFALTHRLTVFADRPWFLCELVSAKNIGTTALDVNAFYFREYAPYFADKHLVGLRHVPNLWKGPSQDAWVGRDGSYFGGLSLAPTVSLFAYHIMDRGRSQHPDAMFSPEAPLVLAPGQTYTPSAGAIWMLAIGGTEGVSGWKNELSRFSL